MKVLSWNCRGLGNPRRVRASKKLIANIHPGLVIFIETKEFENEINK